MKELVTNQKLEIKNQNDFKHSLKSKLVDYEIKYKKFSDIWEFKNKSFQHSLWYNRNKLSKIKTKQRRELKEVIVFNLILMALFFITLFANNEYKPFEGTDYAFLSNEDIIMEIFVVLIAGTNWLVYYLKPHHKERLAEEHNTVVEAIKSIASN